MKHTSLHWKGKELGVAGRLRRWIAASPPTRASPLAPPSTPPRTPPGERAHQGMRRKENAPPRTFAADVGDRLVASLYDLHPARRQAVPCGFPPLRMVVLRLRRPTVFTLLRLLTQLNERTCVVPRRPDRRLLRGRAPHSQACTKESPSLAFLLFALRYFRNWFFKTNLSSLSTPISALK